MSSPLELAISLGPYSCLIMALISLSPSDVRSLQFSLFFSLFCNILFIGIYFLRAQPPAPPPPHSSLRTGNDYTSTSSITYKPTLFIGGFPCSGTDLPRDMLATHPDLHCGDESDMIVSSVLQERHSMGSRGAKMRLNEASITSDLLDKAMASFVSEMLGGHRTQFLCYEDRTLYGHMGEVDQLFPNAKFVIVIRDGRAVAYSMVRNNVTLQGERGRNFTSYLQAADLWNKHMFKMIVDCTDLGDDRCLLVYYEHLVTDPKTWMEKILAFGGIPWHENVLHHEVLAR